MSVSAAAPGHCVGVGVSVTWGGSGVSWAAAVAVAMAQAVDVPARPCSPEDIVDVPASGSCVVACAPVSVAVGSGGPDLARVHPATNINASVKRTAMSRI